MEVPEWPPFGTAGGRLRYERTGCAKPVAPDRVHRTMTYRTLDGNTEIARATAEYDWWIVTADQLAAELRHAGAGTVRVDDDLVIAHADRAQNAV